MPTPRTRQHTRPQRTALAVIAAAAIAGSLTACTSSTPGTAAPSERISGSNALANTTSDAQAVATELTALAKRLETGAHEQSDLAKGTIAILRAHSFPLNLVRSLDEAHQQNGGYKPGTATLTLIRVIPDTLTCVSILDIDRTTGKHTPRTNTCSAPEDATLS
jgi:hypothetical protein